MASFGGYPQNVTYQTVNVSAGGGSENLLINPRGKINQANESGGVLAAGAYFCDGWKAGAAGAEVYVDADGFRLISGSIVQLVPNNLGAGRNIRGNMDIVSGTPTISINGDSDNVTSNAAEYIQFEVSGNNSKFTRLILAESNSLPIYQQASDELTPCLKFLIYDDLSSGFYSSSSPSGGTAFFFYSFDEMVSTPAVSFGASSNAYVSHISQKGVSLSKGGTYCQIREFIMLDARP
ncbi:hypothetical protein OPW33_24270 [Vibrio europaeus]|uniref:hypothetical protein n=1 Tax=Vibrio europaeus TaxID=300876 RepID=UPI002340F039|nr:hypothetical protein [Vibrio europaeus]MDC5840188.1 hypothetical protein [Vibrio europaeus]MDC5840207.1 hypothetical protein [Vibrio europaeus]MDC5842446.1 hypothetical protein [Vibrio europaeus]